MNDIFLLFTPTQMLFVGLVLILFLFITLYQMLVYRQPVRAKNRNPKREEDELPSISVVLSVTNEYKMLRRLLPTLLTQDYPCYEVVVVNDRSEDNSEILLRSLQEQYPHLQARTTSTDDRFGRSPSLALGVGIRAAQYDTILCIEANCYVKDAHWIRSMAALYGGNTEIVLGHTTYRRCSVWKRCDLLQHALHYMGLAALHLPYTGVGSNLLFKKSLFYDNNGFNVRLTRDHFPLGVFIGEVAKSNNCRICIHPSGVTHSRYKMNGNLSRIHRKMVKRSLSMSPKMTKSPMIVETTLRLLFYLSACLSMALFYHTLELFLLFCSMLLLRFLSVFLLYRGVKKRLDDQGLAFPFLCWDVLFPFLNLYRLFR